MKKFKEWVITIVLGFSVLATCFVVWALLGGVMESI
jgi:hypothetical protein